VIAASFMRSAMPPMIRATVMMANIPWNIMNSSGGMDVGKYARAGGSDHTPIPFMKAKSRLPISSFPDPKARVNPTVTHIIVTTPRAIRLCPSMDSMLFFFSMPP